METLIVDFMSEPLIRKMSKVIFGSWILGFIHFSNSGCIFLILMLMPVTQHTKIVRWWCITIKKESN